MSNKEFKTIKQKIGGPKCSRDLGDVFDVPCGQFVPASNIPQYHRNSSAIKKKNTIPAITNM